MNITVVAGGEATAAWLRAALAGRRPDFLVAADGGVVPLLAAGLRPDVLIGDFDSAPAAAVELCRTSGARVLSFPPEKDETDLELALNWADETLRRAGAADEIRLLGAGGKRTDHLLANLALMLKWAQLGRRVRMVNPGEECWVAGPGREELTGEAGGLLSVLPLSAAAELSYQGLYYPLHRQTLRQNSARGVSNRMLGGHAVVEVHAGWVLLVQEICNRAAP
ncbi:MAG: thiamine diphosphokinase [Gracilibacteraceae bacterium]|jgi:thiamine pyrophosphokinase|nr:thiamine diphosphokinase [Gracilibacteraceae bacterium]